VAEAVSAEAEHAINWYLEKKEPQKTVARWSRGPAHGIHFRPAVARAAAANITVKNGERCTEGWTLAVDGSPPRRHHGRTAAPANLLPGLRKVEVTGTIDGRSVCAAQTFLAAAGSVVDLSLKLE
jgi:hypothetical protein